jgi:ribosome biogenesis protein Tsr3
MNPYEKVIISGMDKLDFHNYEEYMKIEDKSKCKCKKCRKRKLEKLNKINKL